jgi:hypothetical protein
MAQTLNAMHGATSHADFFLPLRRRELQADFMSVTNTKAKALGPGKILKTNGWK